jgi:hypothetical protein
MQPLYPPAAPQSIGQVLDSGFRIFQVSLVSCLLYGALSMIAGQLPNIYFIASGRALSPFGGGSPLWIGLYFVGALIMLVMYAALIYRQHGVSVGARLGTSVELSQALRKLPAYLALVLLSILVLFVVPGIIVGVCFAVVRSSGASAQMYAVLALSGLIALVPLLYVMTPIALAPASLLLDGRGPWQSIRHVMRLVRGSWWRTSTIIAVAGVLIIVFYGVAMVIVGLVLPLAGATDVAAVTAATGVVYVVLGSIGLPFFSAVLLATYGELKVRKEGFDLEQRVALVAQT